MHVLVASQPPEDHPLTRLASRYADRLEIRRSTEPRTFSFMLVDEVGFQFQTDRKRAEAIVFFHHPDAAANIGSMKRVFDESWKKATSALYPPVASAGQATL